MVHGQKKTLNYTNSDISWQFRKIYKNQLPNTGEDCCRVLHNRESSQG